VVQSFFLVNTTFAAVQYALMVVFFTRYTAVVPLYDCAVFEFYYGYRRIFYRNIDSAFSRLQVTIPDGFKLF